MNKKRRYIPIAIAVAILLAVAVGIRVDWTERLQIGRLQNGNIPPAPALAVNDALKTIHTQSGFVLEEVASEPNVFSPVTLTFDGNGRIWVCEFVTFMQDVDGTGEEEPRSNIVILEDLDGDGVVDKRTVFLDDVVLPRAIAMVEGGILYADQTQLYFAEVLEGDILGQHDVVDATYAMGGNVEHKANGLHYGLDNWYFNANSDWKYRTVALDGPIPVGSEEIYRNKYWKMVRSKSKRRGQWGISSDDYGRLFFNGNSSPPMGEFFRAGVVDSLANFDQSPQAQPIGGPRVFPIRVNPGVNRGYVGRGTLVKGGSDAGKLKNFTSAGGVEIYRGDNFPAEYYGMAVVTEPAGNLISARQIREGSSNLFGKELFEGAEILASTDERFRPVNLFTAPDGTLYITDMYHGIIQHKTYLSDYLRRQIFKRDLDQANNVMGRIFRLKWGETQDVTAPAMDNLSPNELVVNLEHSNGWWRDNARRLIVESRDKSVYTELLRILRTNSDHRVKIGAIWTLHGLNAIDLEVVEFGFASDNHQVQMAAIAVSKDLPVHQQEILVDILLKRAKNNSSLAVEIVLAAGELQTDRSLDIIATVLDRYADIPFVLEAAFAAVSGQVALLEPYIDERQFSELLALAAAQKTANTLADKRPDLSDTDQSAYDIGQKLFNGKGGCSGCHGTSGKGIADMGPPLVSSEWVLDNPERLAKVMLYGLEGQITVNGREFDPPMPMPGLAENGSFDNHQLAAIATYIRNAWTNVATAVSPEVFSSERKNTRTQPYEARALQ